jgi:hypothetical protein
MFFVFFSQYIADIINIIHIDSVLAINIGSGSLETEMFVESG